MCTKQAENPANVWGRLGDAVAAVAAIDSSALAGEAAGEQLLALRPLIDQLEAVFSGLAARFDASGAHEQAGARTAPARRRPGCGVSCGWVPARLAELSPSVVPCRCCPAPPPPSPLVRSDSRTPT